MTKTKSEWPDSSKELAIQLHSQLRLNNKHWHEFKGNSDRRAAELLSSAIVQLISEGKPSDIEELLKQSIRWIKKEIKAPSCPDH